MSGVEGNEYRDDTARDDTARGGMVNKQDKDVEALNSKSDSNIPTGTINTRGPTTRLVLLEHDGKIFDYA